MCGIFIDFIDKCHARNITFLQQEWDTFLKIDQELWLTGILFLTYTLIWCGSLEERLLISDNGPWQLAIPTIIKLLELENIQAYNTLHELRGVSCSRVSWCERYWIGTWDKLRSWSFSNSSLIFLNSSIMAWTEYAVFNSSIVISWLQRGQNCLCVKCSWIHASQKVCPQGVEVASEKLNRLKIIH